MKPGWFGKGPGSHQVQPQNNKPEQNLPKDKIKPKGQDSSKWQRNGFGPGMEGRGRNHLESDDWNNYLHRWSNQ